MTAQANTQPAEKHVTSSSQPIRFRSENDTPTGSFGEVFLMLALLLATFIAAVLIARKMGWLARWGIAATQPDVPAVQQLRVEQTLRLSPRSALYRVRDGEATLLILESNGVAQMVNTPQVKDVA